MPQVLNVLAADTEPDQSLGDVLLPGADLESAGAFSERVRERLRSLYGQGLPLVTFSAGATAAAAPENIESLLKRADMALYAAKARGRDQPVVDGAAVVGNITLRPRPLTSSRSRETAVADSLSVGRVRSLL